MIANLPLQPMVEFFIYRYVPKEKVSQKNGHFFILDGHGSHVTMETLE
jgi:hypothetical protein